MYLELAKSARNYRQIENLFSAGSMLLWAVSIRFLCKKRMNQDSRQKLNKAAAEMPVSACRKSICTNKILYKFRKKGGFAGFFTPYGRMNAA